MRGYAIVIVALILCFGFTGLTIAQQPGAATTEIGKPLHTEPARLRQPVPAARSTASAAAAENVTRSADPAGSSAPQQPRSFWQKTKSATAAAGRYTWKGIKTASVWTWNGIKKGGYYMKEGVISVAEKTGMIKDTELDAHQDIVNLANKTLVKSQTKREIRQDILERTDSEKRRILLERE